MRVVWFREEWAQLSITDWYLMRVVQLLEAIWLRLRRLKDLESYRLAFDWIRAPRSVTKTDNEAQQKAKHSRAIWRAQMKNPRGTGKA